MIGFQHAPLHMKLDLWFHLIIELREISAMNINEQHFGCSGFTLEVQTATIFFGGLVTPSFNHFFFVKVYHHPKGSMVATSRLPGKKNRSNPNMEGMGLNPERMVMDS